MSSLDSSSFALHGAASNQLAAADKSFVDNPSRLPAREEVSRLFDFKTGVRVANAMPKLKSKLIPA
jgi:hypothetical protein